MAKTVKTVSGLIEEKKGLFARNSIAGMLHYQNIVAKAGDDDEEDEDFDDDFDDDFEEDFDDDDDDDDFAPAPEEIDEPTFDDDDDDDYYDDDF
jgi:CCR4-NOT transcription complex subunit 4